jgi:hypothetical protein
MMFRNFRPLQINTTEEQDKKEEGELARTDSGAVTEVESPVSLEEEIKVLKAYLKEYHLHLSDRFVARLKENEGLVSHYQIAVEALIKGRLLVWGNFDRLAQREDMGLVASYLSSAAYNEVLTQSIFDVTLSQADLMARYPDKKTPLLQALDKLTAGKHKANKQAMRR